jgi:hypothetical protein
MTRIMRRHDGLYNISLVIELLRKRDDERRARILLAEATWRLLAKGVAIWLRHRVGHLGHVGDPEVPKGF